MGDNQWAYKKPSGKSYRDYLARLNYGPTFWEGVWMEKKEWPMAFSHADEELETRYKDWSNKELIATAGWLLEHKVKEIEGDLESAKSVASSHLYELERRIRCQQSQSQSKTPTSSSSTEI